MSIIERIHATNRVIEENIRELKGNRKLLASNILCQLRNLVEPVAVLYRGGDPNALLSWDEIRRATDPSYIAQMRELRFLYELHRRLQQTVSHYTIDLESAEFFLLNLFPLLIKLKNKLRQDHQIYILEELNNFPFDMPPKEHRFYKAMIESIEQLEQLSPASNEGIIRGRYTIHSKQVVQINGKTLHEIVVYPTTDWPNTFDRLTVFSLHEINSRYSVNLTLQTSCFDGLNRTVPFTVVTDWGVSIQPIALKNLGKILGMRIDVKGTDSEYQTFMDWLTKQSANILDLVDLPDSEFEVTVGAVFQNLPDSEICQLLKTMRDFLNQGKPGTNIVRYLLLKMDNQIISNQMRPEPNHTLSNLCLKNESIPFDTMPFCTSLYRHNPGLLDLIDCLDLRNREHELLARKVRTNSENNNLIYTQIPEGSSFEQIQPLLKTYSSKLYHKHTGRTIDHRSGMLYLRENQSTAIEIAKNLRKRATRGDPGYEAAAEIWLQQREGQTGKSIDDEKKQDAVARLFSDSRVAIIYGAAGTGKTRLMEYIAEFYKDTPKLFLAHTNPAVENLRRRMPPNNSSFLTIESFLSWGSMHKRRSAVIFVDECNTITNKSFLTLLNEFPNNLLILSGDPSQIGAIGLGTWFKSLRCILPPHCIFELEQQFRSTNDQIHTVWEKVRNRDSSVISTIARYGFTRSLDDSLFQSESTDEIILSFSYGGVYGINNLNRIIQTTNENPLHNWGASTYKVGDPVLFTDSPRYRDVIYNNLKGTITNIEPSKDRILFHIHIDTHITEQIASSVGLRLVGDSTIEIEHRKEAGENDEYRKDAMPFHVAYATSIHKAQGLEYESVKIVIPNKDTERISHGVLYTAITRAKDSLVIYGSPETLEQVFKQAFEKTPESDTARFIGFCRDQFEN